MFLLSMLFVNEAARSELVDTVEVPSEASWEECGLRMLSDSGRGGLGAQQLPKLYRNHSVSKEDTFVKYLFAVIYVESRFNKAALSPQQAYGLMQMTLVAVQDAEIHCKLKPVLNMEHLFDSATNIRYGSCYLKKLLDEMDGDWTRTLIAYNGGYKQLTKYDKGEMIVSETANYVLRVERARRICNITTTEKQGESNGTK